MSMFSMVGRLLLTEWEDSKKPLKFTVPNKQGFSIFNKQEFLDEAEVVKAEVIKEWREKEKGEE